MSRQLTEIKEPELKKKKNHVVILSVSKCLHQDMVKNRTNILNEEKTIKRLGF